MHLALAYLITECGGILSTSPLRQVHQHPNCEAVIIRGGGRHHHQSQTMESSSERVGFFPRRNGLLASSLYTTEPASVVSIERLPSAHSPSSSELARNRCLLSTLCDVEEPPGTTKTHLYVSLSTGVKSAGTDNTLRVFSRCNEGVPQAKKRGFVRYLVAYFSI